MKHDFMSHELHLPELTFRGMLLGVLITIIPRLTFTWA